VTQPFENNMKYFLYQIIFSNKQYMHTI